MTNSNTVVYTNEVINSKIEEAMLCLDFKVTTEKFGTIPENLCDKRRKPSDKAIEAGRPADDYYVSAEFLLSKLNELEEVESQHVIDQREKSRRVEAYRKQLETSQEIIFLTGNFEFDYIPKS